MTMNVKCYSYIRWSSDVQAAGTSYERQTVNAKRVAAEHGLEYQPPVAIGFCTFTEFQGFTDQYL